MKREQTLQKAIVDYLRYALPPEWKVASIPNGGHSASARITNHAMGMLAGMPDIMILGDSGRVWFCEVKCPLDYEGRPSTLSPATSRACRAEGAGSCGDGGPHAGGGGTVRLLPRHADPGGDGAMTSSKVLAYRTKDVVDALNEDMDRGQWEKALSRLPTIERALKGLLRERDRRIDNKMNVRHRYKHAEIFRRVVYGFESCSKVARDVGCSATTLTSRVKAMARAKGCPQEGLFIGAFGCGSTAIRKAPAQGADRPGLERGRVAGGSL